MIRRQRRRRAQRGFTMIELMVALTLFSLVTAGMLSVAVTMVTGFSDQEATISTEGASRATIDYLADALRNSSPGVQTGRITNLDSSLCQTDTLSMTQNTATVPFGHTSDSLTVLYASGSVVTTSTSIFAGAGTLNVIDGSQFEDDDYAVITNFTDGYFVHIEGHSATTLTVSSLSCATPFTSVAAGSTVIRARKATFSIGTMSSDAAANMPVLMMDGDAEGTRITTATSEPFAEGVERLEIVIGHDTDGNGALGLETGVGDEWVGNNASDAIPASLAVTGTVASSVRAARISIVARSARELQGKNNFRLSAVEDAAQGAATDNFRRRTLTTSVEIRNLGGSP
jgi:prepilin-type N-terminal cleavage/methylation domain-containing protein